MSPPGPDAEHPGGSARGAQSNRHQAQRPPQATAWPNCCLDCRLQAAAESAIENHQLEQVDNLVLCPDTIALQAIANGDTVTPTWRLVRSDGRCCLVYRAPAVAA